MPQVVLEVAVLVVLPQQMELLEIPIKVGVVVQVVLMDLMVVMADQVL
jgi:hypothetical protein